MEQNFHIKAQTIINIRDNILIPILNKMSGQEKFLQKKKLQIIQLLNEFNLNIKDIEDNNQNLNNLIQLIRSHEKKKKFNKKDIETLIGIYNNILEKYKYKYNNSDEEIKEKQKEYEICKFIFNSLKPINKSVKEEKRLKKSNSVKEINNNKKREVSKGQNYKNQYNLIYSKRKSPYSSSMHKKLEKCGSCSSNEYKRLSTCSSINIKKTKIKNNINFYGLHQKKKVNIKIIQKEKEAIKIKLKYLKFSLLLTKIFKDKSKSYKKLLFFTLKCIPHSKNDKRNIKKILLKQQIKTRTTKEKNKERKKSFSNNSTKIKAKILEKKESLKEAKVKQKRKIRSKSVPFFQNKMKQVVKDKTIEKVVNNNSNNEHSPKRKNETNYQESLNKIKLLTEETKNIEYNLITFIENIDNPISTNHINQN